MEASRIVGFTSLGLLPDPFLHSLATCNLSEVVKKRMPPKDKCAIWIVEEDNLGVDGGVLVSATWTPN